MTLSTKDLAELLQSKIASDRVFYGNMHPTPDSIVFITASGGTPNLDLIGFDEQKFQVRTRGANYDAAEALSKRAHAALNGVAETVINGFQVRYILAEQLPFFMGNDANARPEFAFNVRLRANQ